MRRFFVFILFCFVSLLLFSCKNEQYAKPQDTTLHANKEVRYIVARNYFANNTLSDTANMQMIINTQAEFDKYFSPAAYMGKGGQPTQIDFNHQKAICFILPVTNIATDINCNILNTDKIQKQLLYIIMCCWARKSHILFVHV